MLPHLQEDNQRHHQDLQKHVGLCWKTLSSAQDMIKTIKDFVKIEHKCLFVNVCSGSGTQSQDLVING